MPIRSSRRSFLKRSALASLAASAFSGRLPAKQLGAGADWRYYAATPEGTRYSALDQIDTSNVGDLRVAWTHATGDSMARPATTIECTPIIVDGRMYITTAQLQIRALDAATGKALWNFDPFEGIVMRRAKGVNRGVTYWSDGERRRVFSAAGDNLYCLDADSGRPVGEFADNGVLDMRTGLDREVGAFSIRHPTPPVIFEDLLILGSSATEGPGPAAPGHFRGYDVRTGERRWIFHTIPHPGEFGYETWGKENWKTNGGCNNWAGMSVDEERAMVFASTGSPTFDFYGADRPGMNLYGNSVVALDARTGERKWHFQTTHHDLWDYDNPAQPCLIRVKRGGEWTDAVAQITKTGFLFLFDRVTGEPIFEVEERRVPESEIEGEQVWPTQPFPTRPEPISRQGFTEADVTDISPESRDYVLRQLKDLRNGTLYTPPSKQGTVFFPGTLGGGLWGGCSCDPENGRLYINANNAPKFFTLIDAAENEPFPYRIAGYPYFNDQDGYPAAKPPWGELLCLDLATSEYRWRKPLGEHAALTAKGVPQTGTFNVGGAVVTRGGLLFIGATRDEKFRAFDSASGAVLWEHGLSAGGYASPCTYAVDGKQYVVIAAGGAGKGRTKSGDEFVAFALG